MTPTFTHGKNSKVLANGYDVSAWFKSIGGKRAADTAETSTIGSSSKSYIGGLSDGTLTFDGYADGTAAGISTQMNTILGTSTVWTYIGAQDAVGTPGLAANAIENDVEITSDVGAVVTIKGTAQSTTGLEPVLVLHALGAEAAGGSSVQVDNGASSANGASSYLQVTGVGTTLTAKTQHSVDGTTWVDLIAHTAVTVANKAERLTVTGTVNRYLRALWTETGTATFHLAACRY